MKFGRVQSFGEAQAKKSAIPPRKPQKKTPPRAHGPRWSSLEKRIASYFLLPDRIDP
jgi:hypothetical protein